MTDSLASRVLHSYLNNLRIDYIAKVESISIAEVERIIGKAMTTGRFGL